MQPTIIQQDQPKRHILPKIIVSIVALIVVAGIVVLAAHFMHQFNLREVVKSEIILQNKTIQAASQGGLYSSESVASIASTERVAVSVSVSGDGTVYCLEAKNVTDISVVYHMDQDSDEQEPTEGGCAATATVPPLAPADVTVGSIGAGVVSLAWAEVPYAAEYTAQCATDDSFTAGIVATTVSAAVVTVEGLEGASQYHCRVAASNPVGQSAWSESVNAVTNTVSLRPTHLVVAGTSSTEIRYSWQALDGAASYVLEYAEDSDFSVGVVSLETQDTSGIVSRLKPYTAYFFHVKAVTAGFDAEHASFSDIGLARTTES